MSTSLPIQRIAADVCAAPQLSPSSMADVAAAGFRSVINNRPDFEHGLDQPTSAAIETAALAAGLQYAHLPVAGGYQSPDEIARFAELIAAMPRPLLCFCRSGARSTRLFVAATQAG